VTLPAKGEVPFPRVPTAGETWVQVADGGDGFVTAVDVLEPGPYYVRLFLTTLAGVHGEVSWSLVKFNRFTERAVRVDDKPRGQ
jgi:hypothetical protein